MISLFLSPRFPAVNPRRPTFLPPPTNQPTPLWEIKTSFSCFHNLWQVSSFSLSPSQPFGASSSLLARASFYTFFFLFISQGFGICFSRCSLGSALRDLRHMLQFCAAIWLRDLQVLRELWLGGNRKPSRFCVILSCSQRGSKILSFVHVEHKLNSRFEI